MRFNEVSVSGAGKPRVAGGVLQTRDDAVKFDEQERTALTDAGFSVADNSKAAYVEAVVVIAAYDAETYWLTFALPNDAQIVCVVPRDQIADAIKVNHAARRNQFQ